MHDNSIDCAISLQLLINGGVNTVLKKFGYPTINCRIGLDTGSAMVTETNGRKDLLGSTVNLASKIQSAAKPGEILMGEVTERNLHTKWRRNTVEVTDERNWNFERSGERYQIYSYQLDG